MGRETRPRAREAAAPAGAMLAGLLAVASLTGQAAAQEQPAPPATEVPVTCSKSEFESAVDHAAETLRDLNNKNRPPFQGKLRQLKEKRGWNDSQFLKEAEPFVKDERIADFDTKTNELLMSISSMGQEGANAPEPDCKMLADLRGLMQVLVETQSAKWTYMAQRLESELAK
jgi:hypothetical protein